MTDAELEALLCAPPSTPAHQVAFAYRVSDKPDVWLTVISPDGLAGARHALDLTFGERLLEVRSR